jgi:hypothetical protein
MGFSEARELRIDLDNENFEVTEADIQGIEAEVDLIRPLVKDFPTATLYINLIYAQPTQRFQVKTALVLPGRTLATGDTADHWQPSLEKCLRKLMHRIAHYKSDMSGDPDQHRRSTGKVHDVEPTQQVDGKAVQEAYEEGDYVAFRRTLTPYEASLRQRIGRWVERYPQVAAVLGSRLEIADIIEETFLLAFERYEHWPREMQFGQWLEQQIDPAVQLIARHPTRELETISYMRTLQEAMD